MDTTAAQPLDVSLSFGWPYNFYSSQEIQKQYMLKHKDHNVSVSYEDDHNIFRLKCKYHDTDYHIKAFIRFINGYVADELHKSFGDVLGQDAVQVEILRDDSNNRSRYFKLARRYAIHEEASYGDLIESEAFSTALYYNNQITKTQHINRKLFEDIASRQACRLNWLKDGLQILSESEKNLRAILEVLQPTIALFDGTRVDLYWVDNLLQHKFRFRKPARFADHSMYETKDLASKLLDLHLTQWNSNSLQDITLKSQNLGKIEYSNGTKNPWNRKKRFQYGADENHPNYWADTTTLSGGIPHNFMLPERADQIHNWVEQIGHDVQDLELQGQDPTSTTFQDSSKKTSDFGHTEQAKKTDIEERLQSQEAFNLNKPRTRPAPRLKASYDSSSLWVSRGSEGSEKIRQNFMDILLQRFLKLMSTVSLVQHETSSLVVKFGQLFVHSATVPLMYQPYQGRDQEALLPMDWTQLFPESPSLDRSYFSRRLTSSADDALYMSMTVKQNNKGSNEPQFIFQRKPYLDQTTYRICCQNRTTGKTASIVIDQNGNSSIESNPQELGYINIHFPQFIWDARVSCNTKSALSNEDKDAFERILSTIWIRHGHDLSTEERALYVRRDTRMTILSCQHRRERVHYDIREDANEKAVSLHITRIENLKAVDTSSTVEGMHVFTTASSNNQASTYAGHQEQNHWYEAHLSSTIINNLLPDPVNPAPAFLTPNSHNSLREALTPLFSMARSLISEWDNVGSGDRAMAARFGDASSITAQSVTSDIMARANRGRSSHS